MRSSYKVCEKPCSRIGRENLAAPRGSLFLFFHLAAPPRSPMSKRSAATQKKVVPEESGSDSDSDEKPAKPPTAKQPKANAANFPRPQGAAPKDQISGSALAWNGEVGQWEHIVDDEVVYSRQPKSNSTTADPTPSKKAAAPAAAATTAPVPVSAVVTELDDAAQDDASGEDEFVVKMKKQQKKIRKKADKEIAVIDQLIADHAEEQQLRSRLPSRIRCAAERKQE